MSSLHTVDTLGVVIQTGSHWFISPLTDANSAGEGTSFIGCSDDVQIPAWYTALCARVLIVKSLLLSSKFCKYNLLLPNYIVITTLFFPNMYLCWRNIVQVSVSL